MKMYKIQDYLTEQENGFLIYCDMDGVLTNFQDHFIRYYHNEFRDTELYTNSPESFPEFPQAKTTQDITDKLSKKNKYAITRKASKEYWSEMPWHPDGKALWKAIKPLNPIILSTPAASANSKEGKMVWVKKNLKISTVILSANKYEYVKDNLFVPKGKENYKRILIDDTPKKITGWTSAGGIGILHKSARETISKLKKLGAIK
tara:strand:- start:3479 stop:4090 length:612 start_codon:yes stop_codon:yes gene_type:complete